MEIALLKKIFYSAKTGFQPSKLYGKAKAINPRITKKQVDSFLKDQSANQPFFQRKVKVHYPLIATRSGRIQIDLMDMSNEDIVKNKGKKWIFCAIDVFSRYAWFYTQKNKTVKSCVESLNALIRDVPFKIYQIDSDSESAFLSREFIRILQKEEIIQNLAPIGDKHRMGIVERLNLTVRQFLNRYKEAYKTNDWSSALSGFSENYNTTTHRTLRMSPREALASGLGSLKYQFNQTINASNESYNKESIQVGDKVRLRIRHAIFDKKSSSGVWTKTIHTVEKIDVSEISVNDRKTTYRKEDLLKIRDAQGPDEPDDERIKDEPEERQKDRLKSQQAEKRITRAIAKEGIARSDLREPTDEERSERALRRIRNPINRPFMISN